MRKEAVGMVLAILVVASLGAGYLVGNSTRRTVTSTSTSTSVTTTTQTATTSIVSNSTITVVHVQLKNTTVASGSFMIPNSTVPTNSYHNGLGFNHTGVIIASFVVTNQTHLSFNFNFSTLVGGGSCLCPFTIYAEVLGPTGQVLARSGVPNPYIGPWVVTLPPSQQDSQGPQKYYLQILNDDEFGPVIFYPDAYLY
jgi:hypothetical protein